MAEKILSGPITKEVFPESHEFSCNSYFIREVWNTLRESDSDWLINPNHIRKIRPRVWVQIWNWSPGLPQKWAILLKKSVKWRATRATIQPEGNFIRGCWVCGREEPEEESFGAAVGDGDFTSIGFTNGKGNSREVIAIDGEFWTRSAFTRDLIFLRQIWFIQPWNWVKNIHRESPSRSKQACRTQYLDLYATKEFPPNDIPPPRTSPHGTIPFEVQEVTYSRFCWSDRTKSAGLREVSNGGLPISSCDVLQPF